jgi:hypothetical protein
MSWISSQTFKDSDGRSFGVDFHKDPDGSVHAYLKSCPWAPVTVNKLTEHERHLMSNGKICLSTQKLYDHDTAVRRTHLWCNGFSYLMEHGYRETCLVLPEWGR